jgi:hypothetical protein
MCTQTLYSMVREICIGYVPQIDSMNRTNRNITTSKTAKHNILTIIHKDDKGTMWRFQPDEMPTSRGRQLSALRFICFNRLYKSLNPLRKSFYHTNANNYTYY